MVIQHSAVLGRASGVESNLICLPRKLPDPGASGTLIHRLIALRRGGGGLSRGSAEADWASAGAEVPL